MKKYSIILILGNLLLILVFFNKSILDKEAILAEKNIVFLELRSDFSLWIHGNTLSLKYKISENLKTDSIPPRGCVLVKTDSLGIVQKIQIQNGIPSKENNSYLIEYTAGKFYMNIGAPFFVFPEGHQAAFQKAKYGGLKVDDKGNSIFVGLYNEKRQKID